MPLDVAEATVGLGAIIPASENSFTRHLPTPSSAFSQLVAPLLPPREASASRRAADRRSDGDLAQPGI